jgi:hypothetical protein
MNKRTVDMLFIIFMLASLTLIMLRVGFDVGYQKGLSIGVQCVPVKVEVK